VGGVGMIVAVPAAAVVKFSRDSLPSLRPVGSLMGKQPRPRGGASRPPLACPRIFAESSRKGVGSPWPGLGGAGGKPSWRPRTTASRPWRIAGEITGRLIEKSRGGPSQRGGPDLAGGRAEPAPGKGRTRTGPASGRCGARGGPVR
jgi:hypothetical protein